MAQVLQARGMRSTDRRIKELKLSACFSINLFQPILMVKSSLAAREI
ncbi:MAG: hypothetical protein ACTS73_07635 [Arsenophonus sp. NEOnobi-MAG3]